MKKLSKIISITLVLVFLCAYAASAQSVIVSGKTDSNAKGVTILVTKKGTNIQNMSGNDIVWIDQQDIEEDGSFRLKLPVYSEEEHDLFSNSSSKSIEEIKVYVSAAGTGDGTSVDAPTTLSQAYGKIEDSLKIIITEDITYEDAPEEYDGDLFISGLTGMEKLTLPETVSIKGNLTIGNLALKTASKIYANGYNLEIKESVTSDTITLYGGKYGEASATTSLKIYGGTFGYVYGGGHKSAGKVTGSTNITFGGNAIAEYIHGGGCEATASKTNIHIVGGEVTESVYGGISGVNLTADTNIVVSGGKIQSVYGGCFAANMTGNATITLKGGEVTRRIYGGCYNDYSFSWSSNSYVVGSTNIIVYPSANLITGSGLSWSDKTNMGIFGGSRRNGAADDEVNTIIFLDGSFNTYGDDVIKSGTLKSFHDYLVKSSVGGSVEIAEKGKVSVKTVNGITALSNGVRYNNGQIITLSPETIVTYDGIQSADIEENSTTTNANADIVVSSSAELFAAIYDNEDGTLVSCAVSEVDSSKDYTVDLNCKLDVNKKYTAKLYLLKDKKTLVPLSGSYSIEIR